MIKCFSFYKTSLANTLYKSKPSMNCLVFTRLKMVFHKESVINVTMFLIAINDIFQKIPHPTKHIIFADDCYIYCNGKNINTTLMIIQTLLHDLQN